MDMSKKIKDDIPETPAEEPAESLHGDAETVIDTADIAEDGSSPEETEEADLRDERIIAMEAIIEDLRDKQLRAAADAENTRRRAEREKADSLKFGASRLARDLLGVADSLNRALRTVSDETRAVSGDLVTGLELTERELMAAFRRHEILPIDPRGERFDPNLHEAMAQVPGTGQPAGTVVDVIEIGYQINGRLLRPARVAVASATPEKEEASKKPDSEADAD